MLLPETGLIATPPTKEALSKDVENMEVAIQQARLGLEEGGVPIGGALVSIQKPKSTAIRQRLPVINSGLPPRAFSSPVKENCSESEETRGFKRGARPSMER